MKTFTKITSSFVFICIFLFLASASFADTYIPPDSDLGDLDHGMYYTWGMDINWDPVNDILAGATLYFHSIRNWDSNPNDLWVHLIDDAPLGITTGYDGQGGGDQFAGQGVLLFHWEDLPDTPQDLSHLFTNEQVDALNTYAADGRIGLTFDPDCHFYNCGVELEIGKAGIPEPATLSIIAIGMGVLAVIRRKRSA